MNSQTAYESLRQTTLALLPELLLLLSAVAMMTVSVFLRRPRATWWLTSVGVLLVALLVLLALGPAPADLYSSVALEDDLAFGARLVLLLSGLVILLLAHDEPDDVRAGEFFGALLVVDAGTMLVAAANELVFLFVGLELVSIPTYLLLYLSRRNRLTQEAATKYFFLSIFASGLLLYGLAFLYGATGLGNLKAISFLIERLPGVPQSRLGLLAVMFILGGLCLKATAVPLHFYAPDVYQGSPAVIAAVLAWLPKAAGFLAIVRALTAVLSAKDPADPLLQKAVMISWIIAAASMIWGNFVALLQDNLKRLMAYSSIAHAGYLMIGVSAGFLDGRPGGSVYGGSESVLFYLVAYALMTLGTFGAFIALSVRERPVETVNDLAGLGWSRPAPALALAVCLLSLSGVPPLLGFWGKLEIFAAALGAEEHSGHGAFLLLAVIGMVAAAVGAYYYLRIVVVMYFRAPGDPVVVRGGWPVAAAVTACASLTVVLGLFVSPLTAAARAAARAALIHPTPQWMEGADDDHQRPRAPVHLVHE
jgi:NADH-quinone oxidoreductase subunit N